MLVHRLLDAVFRTLDLVDLVRARLEQAAGRDPQPPSQWPPAPEASSGRAPGGAHAGEEAAEQPTVDSGPGDTDGTDAGTAPAAAGVTGGRARSRAKSTARPAAKAAARSTATAKAAAPKTGDVDEDKPASRRRSTTAPRPRPVAKKKAAANRKGSVDRSGKDFDSPRAQTVWSDVKKHKRPIVDANAAVGGKKTLARVLWACCAAVDAGEPDGLTAADASALLSVAAGLEVFATNIGRTFREETDLFAETRPDGRSKRYKPTAAGRARLAEVLPQSSG